MFIDLKKAYDSVQRNILWEYLASVLGEDSDLVACIKCLYVGARMHLKEDLDNLFESIYVKLGLK